MLLQKWCYKLGLNASHLKPPDTKILPAKKKII